MSDLDLRNTEEIRASVAKLPKETRQKVLDLIHESKTPGDISREMNLPLMDVCEILNQNIYAVHLLNKEAKE